MSMSIKKPKVTLEVVEVDTKHNEREINDFKVGDKVLYNGEVRTVIQVPDEKTFNEVGYLHKDYVVLDLDYDNAIYYKDIELYKSAHDKLLELGFSFWDNSNGLQYDKGDLRILIDKQAKTYKASWFVDDMAFSVDLELSKILTQYLEELENENE